MSDDLVPVATIFSRPELICFVAALEDCGIHCCIVGNHYGNATQHIVAMGGYSVRVPETDVDTAIALIDELRIQTVPSVVPKSLKRRIWILFAFLSAMGTAQTYVAQRAFVEEIEWRFLLIGWMNVLTYPFPMVLPGDYLNRRRRLVQMA